MSLLDSMMEPCVVMDKVTVDDPMGGFYATWTEGAHFDAYVRKEIASEITVAEQKGANEAFTLVVRRGTYLSYHDVIKRLSDGAVFRLTSNVKDQEAPDMASISASIARANCERWELT